MGVVVGVLEVGVAELGRVCQPTVHSGPLIGKGLIGKVFPILRSVRPDTTNTSHSQDEGALRGEAVGVGVVVAVTQPATVLAV